MHELPPLLVHGIPEDASREELVERAAAIVETEDMIADASPEALGGYSMEHRKLDLALHLTDQYFGLLSHWAWGDSVLEWIRQCEITFAATSALRPLLSGDVWPHAARSSFVDLLLEKHVSTPGVAIDKAVGMRLTFRQPPPIDCCSNQFLFFLNSRLAGAAYETWARMSPESAGHLPPNRFHFEIHDMRPQ
jgi:hypothetical protein